MALPGHNMECIQMTDFSFKMNDADIIAGIKSVGNRAKSLRVDIQKLAVSITLNWAKAGAANIAAERMTSLLNNVDPSHKQKLVNWCDSFCGFTLTEDKDGNDMFSYGRTTMSEEQWGECKANNLFDHTPDLPPVAFNFKAKFQQLIEAAEKRSKVTDDSKRNADDNIPAELVASAKALLAAIPAVEPDF
jgi:hypothetical protein